VKALALVKPQLHLNKNKNLNESKDLTQREKLAIIRLREEMQREKPIMLNCSKDAHIFEVFSVKILIYGPMVFVTARN
jgi:hypothetical protein